MQTWAKIIYQATQKEKNKLKKEPYQLQQYDHALKEQQKEKQKTLQLIPKVIKKLLQNRCPECLTTLQTNEHETYCPKCGLIIDTTPHYVAGQKINLPRTKYM